MPTHGREFAPRNLAQQASYHGARRRLRELPGLRLAEREAAHQRRAEERRAAVEAKRSKRESREWRRQQLRDWDDENAAKRANARAALDALRMDPAYDLERRWGRRVNDGTLYDAQAWRSRGRLVPVTERTRYSGGVRREVVDWTDILDREAQSAGYDPLELPRQFERIRKQRAAVLALAREAEEGRRERDEFARESLT